MGEQKCAKAKYKKVYGPGQQNVAEQGKHQANADPAPIRAGWSILQPAEQRLQARQPDRQVVCHGDPHEGNLLRVLSPRPGAPADAVWVDPDGFRCEPDYDLGVAVRNANKFVLASDDPVVMLRGWCARLADQTGTDAEAIWQWGFLERVSTGLYLLDRGLVDRGRRYLQAARWLISRRSFG